MTIDKAIEILSAPTWQDLTLHDPDFEAATKLGEEALKCIRHYRRDTVNSTLLPLPGETEE